MWNASTNSPILSNATGTAGYVYRVSTGGTRNLGSGNITFDVGDYAIFSSVNSAWEKADTTDAVSSVAGRTGDVTLSYLDLGASGTPSSSNFLRGDGSWQPTSGITRSVQTITAETTLPAATSTDYVYFLSSTTTPSSDANFSSVTALLHLDGANNATSPITDSSSLAANWTASGTAKLSTGTTRYGSATLSLASNDRITSSAATSNFGFGSGAFTIELNVNLTGVTSAQNIYVGGGAGATDPVIYVSGGKIIYYVGSDRITSTSSVSAATWYHIAVSRSSTTTRLFINGTLEGSWTDSTSYANGAVSIGSASAGMAGFVDEVRITKGVARYTSAFTAPTAAFPDGPVTALGTPTLPTAVGNTNQYTLKNISGSSITVGVTSSQQIDGATGGLALTNGSAASFISDAANWRTV
jgi:hypothetical protein